MAEVQAARESGLGLDGVSVECKGSIARAHLAATADTLASVARSLEDCHWNYQTITSPPQSVLRGHSVNVLSAALRRRGVFIMSKLQTVLNSVLRSVPDAIAVGVVDLDSGMLLGHAATMQLAPQIEAKLSDATTERFVGTSATDIGRTFDQLRGTQSNGQYIEFDIFGTPMTIHVGFRLPKHPQTVAMFVCTKNAKIGAVHNAALKSLDAIDSAV